MKVLVSAIRGYSTYVSREFYYIMQDLIRVSGWRQIDPSVLAKNPASARATLLDVLGEIPEVILFWEAYDLCIRMHPDLRGTGCRCCLFADDLHWRSESDRETKLAAFSLCDTIFATVAYTFDDFYPELRGKKKVVWTPHSASPDFFLPFNDRPQNAVLLSGVINFYYPLRERMKRLHDGGRYAIELHEHPGYNAAYDYETDARVGTGYARTIQRYKVAFADALMSMHTPRTLRYVVAKFFEIPATGSLLLAEDAVSPQLNELGFFENVHYIPATAQNLEEQIRYVLDPGHDAEFDAIRRRAQELVSSRHKTFDRATLIDRVCTEDASQP